ncbi:MAG: hypothetical protein LUF02_06160 [Erysipelotrichaceae bacterium]|nr:hypothetical protein [Erysipelotrichaceae bacterium]
MNNNESGKYNSYIMNWYKNNSTDLKNFWMQATCFLSVDDYIENPTEEEYMIIADASIRTWMVQCDNLLDLRSIANCLSMDYSSGEIELATLSSMSKYDLAQYLTEKEESEFIL